MALVGRLDSTSAATPLIQSDRVNRLPKELEGQARRTGSDEITLNHLAAALLSHGGFGESLLRDSLSTDLRTAHQFRTRLGLKDTDARPSSQPVNSELVDRVLDGAEAVARELKRDSIGTGEIFISLVKIVQANETAETAELRLLLATTTPDQLMQTLDRNQSRRRGWPST